MVKVPGLRGLRPLVIINEGLPEQEHRMSMAGVPAKAPEMSFAMSMQRYDGKSKRRRRRHMIKAIWQSPSLEHDPTSHCNHRNYNPFEVRCRVSRSSAINQQQFANLRQATALQKTKLLVV